MMDGAAENHKIIGGAHAKVKHDSAVRHVTGEALFIDDIPALPGTLEAVFFTSPHPHAKITSINISNALNDRGVHAVMTAKDIPGVNDIAPVFKDEPILARDIVEYVGQPIALVVAESYDIAFHAAKKVIVEYEVLEPVLSLAKALKKENFTYLLGYLLNRHYPAN